jgi:hypothetical protein
MIFNKILQPIEQHVLDTNAIKAAFLNCHRYLINTGVGKMNHIKI